MFNTRNNLFYLLKILDEELIDEDNEIDFEIRLIY